MPSSRCVAQGCSNYANRNAGISLHLSPIEIKIRVLRVQFVKTHSVNFNPKGRFAICSAHFDDKYFERRHRETKGRSLRRLKNDVYPSICKQKMKPSPLSKRGQRRVSMTRVL